MRFRSASLFVALLGLGSLTAQAQQLNTVKIDSLLNVLAAKDKMMGSLALSHNGKVVYSKAFGYAQLDGATKTPATTATRYRVGSISKTFTATMIFQLIDEGKLSLTTPLATFFPELPNAQKITIDHLLSHHSGLHSFTNDAAYGTYQLQPHTQAQMLDIIKNTKSDFEPGARAEYSNSNYVVLGYIVEKLSKMPYEKALQKRIIAKAGLKSTTYGNSINPKNQDAYSYKPVTASWAPEVETNMSIPGGAGAIVSTPTDLIRFQEALFGGKLVSAASLEAMKTMQDGIGRGMFKGMLNKHESYGHGGSIDGFQSNIGYFPADKLAIALTTNGHSYSLNEAQIGVLSIFFGQPYKVPDFKASSFVPAVADLDRYVGTYASTQIPLKINMTKVGAALQAQATGQGPLLMAAINKDVFTFDEAGIRVEFSASKPEFTLKQGGGTYVFTKE